MKITVFENGKPVEKEISYKEYKEIMERTSIIWRKK